MSALGQSFHAIIVGVEDFGLFCRLSELPVDGLIHVSSLSDDYYYLEPGTHTLVGRRSGRRHRLGDRELVRIAHVDVDRRVLDLALADSTLLESAAPRHLADDRQPAAPAFTERPRGRKPSERKAATIRKDRRAKHSERSEKIREEPERRSASRSGKKEQALDDTSIHDAAHASGAAACARRIDSADGSSSNSVSLPSRSSSTTMNHLEQHPQVASNCIGSPRSGW